MTLGAHRLQPLDGLTTMVDILRARAALDGDARACTFLEDGETEERPITYAQLDRRARAIAATLQRVCGVGARAVLLYPPGLDYVAAFFGCLYAGVVAVPAYPPDPVRLARSLPRLQAVLADAEADLLLTTSAISALAAGLFPYAPDLKTARWLATDVIENGIEVAWVSPSVTGDSLAFLQYTSGSTGTPKGVMLSHANLLHNERLITERFEIAAPAVCVSWLPPYHDMGLIGTVLNPIYLGYPLVAMSPLAFLQRPMRWLEAIQRHRGTVAGGPNFAFELCVRKTTPEQRRALDLSSWELAFCGAEPIRAETLGRFAEAFADAGFRREAIYPCYGLAEGTLIVSGGRKANPPVLRRYVGAQLTRGVATRSAEHEGDGAKTLVGCGTTLIDQDLVIVDPTSLERCPDRHMGEIWVSGPSVARGYWRREAESEKIFAARLAGEARPYLRTGDIGFLDGGELFVTGRAKAVIVQRGRNLHAEDVEQCTERAHPAIRPGCSAAFSIEESDDRGEECLVVVAEVAGATGENWETCIAAVHRKVAEDLDVQARRIVLVRAGTIAKTSSGKIQRHAVRDALLDGALETIAERRFVGVEVGTIDTDAETASPRSPHRQPETPAQTMLWLQARIARLLGVRDEDVSKTEPLTSLGLDSLRIVELQHALENDLGIIMPLRRLLEAESIVALAAQIALGNIAAPAAHDPLPAHEWSLSQGQRALLFLQDLWPRSSAYIIARCLRIRSSIDLPAFRRALTALIARHPILNAAIVRSADGAVLRVGRHGGDVLEYVDAAEWDEAFFRRALADHGARPFDFERGPLFRVAIFQRDEPGPVLSIAIHHIITDFWSLSVMMRDLGALYQAEQRDAPASLPLNRLAFADFVAGEETSRSQQDAERAWSYWRSQLAGDLPELRLPTARVRRRTHSLHGAAVSFALDPDLTAEVYRLARTKGTTPFVMLLAAFFTLLHRVSGQDDVIIGVPSAGRSRAGFADVLGYFVNSLPLRLDTFRDLSVDSVIDRVRAVVNDGIHHELPFSRLVESLALVRDASRSPVFQVMFVLQQTPSAFERSLGAFAVGVEGVRLDIGTLALETMSAERGHAQHDLTLVMAELDGSLRGSFEYNLDLFDRETIRRLTSQFEHLLRGFVAARDTRISALPLGSEAERLRVLDWSHGRIVECTEPCLHESFRAAVERSPSAIAIVDGDRTLTYAALDARADWLAERLRTVGVNVGARVAIVMGRSLELVVGLLATLKAGGAFVAIDPEAPRARIITLLDDVRPNAILTTDRFAGLLAGYQPLTVFVPEDPAAYAITAALPNAARPGDLAYVTFTSGTSGTPKGVMVPHHAIANHLAARQALYPLGAADRFLHKAAITFDIAVWEVFGPLLAGACLVLARDGGQRDPAYLAEICKHEAITVVHFGPAMLREFLDEPRIVECTALRRLFCGGEPLTPELRDRVFEQLPWISLHNQYGPTEAAVDVTFWDCTPHDDDRRVPIGRAIQNTALYVLDEQMTVVHCGVPGELYIGGLCLAWGYLQRPAETAERFVPSPFGPPGTVLYRTGDRALYRDDGSIEFLGRSDRQIKLRGIRVEPGEVESVLRRHPNVRDAVVVVRQDALVGYVATADESLSSEALRTFLRAHLPEHLVPAVVQPLRAFPLTTSGKLDVRGLPCVVADAGVAYVEPRTESERAIAAIWSQVLLVTRVGIDDDFFNLGGHSLRAAQVMARVRERMGIEVPLRLMFDRPTVRALAQAIDDAPRAKLQFIAKSATSVAHDALDRLDELSDEELEALLAKVSTT